MLRLALPRLRARARRVAVVVRRIIGAPDYECYLAHVTCRHPGTTPLSPEAFARDALARRYDRPGSRCC
ncbi:MAG: YbdD/YjiX family protein [bacterium]